MKKLGIIVSLIVFSFAAVPALALKPQTKQAVQQAMKDYVKQVSNSGRFSMVYNGKLLQLRLATSKKYPNGFHAGVKNHGSLYTSCADFEDEKGNKYDIDFLVSRVGEQFHVVQPIVHSINGKKSPFDLTH